MKYLLKPAQILVKYLHEICFLLVSKNILPHNPHEILFTRGKEQQKSPCHDFRIIRPKYRRYIESKKGPKYLSEIPSKVVLRLP